MVSEDGYIMKIYKIKHMRACDFQTFQTSKMLNFCVSFAIAHLF